MEMRRVGFIGAGNMAEALLRGALKSGALQAEDVRVSEPRADRCQLFETQYGVAALADNQTLAAWAEVLVICVKPQLLETVLDEICPAVAANALLLSIVAGAQLSRFTAKLPAGVRVVRAMPNAPALVLVGATGIAGGPTATPDDIDFARQLFDAVGTSFVLEERWLDAVTGLSGSGPAYVMVFIEALADGGVAMGLSRDVAQRLATQTVLGAALWLLDSGEHPAQLKDRVASPGGTTIAGLAALEAHGMRHALISAVRAATERATELGSKLGEQSPSYRPIYDTGFLR